MPKQTDIVPFDESLSIEVLVDENSPEPLSAVDISKKLGDAFLHVRKTLRFLAKEAIEAAKDLEQELKIEDLEIEAGLGIQAEGSVYIVKGSTNANFKVKFKIKPSTES